MNDGIREDDFEEVVLTEDDVEEVDVDELIKSLEETDGRVMVEDAPEYVPTVPDTIDENVAPEIVIHEVKKVRLRKPTPQTLREMKRGEESLFDRYGPIVDGPIDLD